AIQCKCYAQEHRVDKKDLDTFFTASGKKGFVHRLIVSTTDKWTKHAQQALDNQQIPVSRIGFTELEKSSINWEEFSLNNPEKLSLSSNKKGLRPHQQEALDAVIEGFKTSNKGKLIMACGTGKTFTSLKIMERLVPQHKSFVLFLVPSLSLLSQTLTEWKKESNRTIYAFATCSDTKIGRKSDVEEDIQAHDLAIPATTDSEKLVSEVQRAIAHADEGAVTVIFSTYQSIQVVKEAQDKGLPAFDLVICDEAHRTTGIGQDNKEDTPFIRIHDEDYIQAKKRLYMTATPRIYTTNAKNQASNSGIQVYSMDDEDIYGKEFFSLDFSQAVSQNLLSDYKVLILAVDEEYVSVKLQERYADDNHEIPLEDCVKIVGCLNGLAKKIKGEDGVDIEDAKPMQRAVAFTDSIKKSKRIQELFNKEVKQFFDDEDRSISCEARHVDGTMDALEKGKHLNWLKGNVAENECRILTNARCLSEGIDVPVLDAVLFLSPRNSMVDIVQSVGRVMRKSEGKKLGYIILPIAVPANKKPEEALNDNKRYRTVWDVLQALRAHDKRLDAEINKIELNEKKDGGRINIIGVSDKKGMTNAYDDSTVDNSPTDIHLQLPFMEKEWQNAIYAKIVQKCGSRKYWETWAKDIADIASKHIILIKKVVQENKQAYKAFSQFLNGLHKNINDSIKEDDVIEMLAQHSITKPVFDAIFEGYSFTRNNPVSKSLDVVMKIIQKDIEGEVESLEQFYEDVKLRVRGIDNMEGKQKVIIELYDNFFRKAFPKTAERLGIVYTPLEVVDFIIHSVEHVLQTEFDTSFSNKNVQVLDPFTGTGTFIVRLLQSGLIKNKDFLYKYKHEIFANEIILLAYYIATINIENAYHYQTGKENYIPFNGSVLTDTFNMYEGVTEDTSEAMIEELLPENNERLKKQKKSPITVIVGNPPYSIGQKSANDNNQNLKYEQLASRIENTYIKLSDVSSKRGIYDSYIQAIRWASDRIVKNGSKNGIVAFVTNGSFIKSNSMDGIRKCLYKEFSSIYCLNLRGDAHGSGENRRKEGGGIFGEGSRTPVAITILIKKSEKQGECK
ncbi:MAG: DEAD/DEAH box helicase family protein, partial [Desulfovibrionaceae bacterium]|nr:DEAD/DEAH box helicase family protein [Desulfovibrionaceae bacterium]